MALFYGFLCDSPSLFDIIVWNSPCISVCASRAPGLHNAQCTRGARPAPLVRSLGGRGSNILFTLCRFVLMKKLLLFRGDEVMFVVLVVMPPMVQAFSRRD